MHHIKWWLPEASPSTSLIPIFFFLRSQRGLRGLSHLDDSDDNGRNGLRGFSAANALFQYVWFKKSRKGKKKQQQIRFLSLWSSPLRFLFYLFVLHSRWLSKPWPTSCAPLLNPSLYRPWPIILDPSELTFTLISSMNLLESSICIVSPLLELSSLPLASLYSIYVILSFLFYFLIL